MSSISHRRAWPFGLSGAQRTRRCRRALLTILSALTLSWAWTTVRGADSAANAPPLVSDRPDFTESTETVLSGRVQLELGYTFTYDSENGERERRHTAPEALIRIGVLENFELRIGWEGYAWTDTKTHERSDSGRTFHREDSSAGANDVSIGLKLKLAEQSEMRPHLGLIAAVSIPSGSADLSSGDVDPEVVLAWAYDLSEAVSVAGNLGVGAPTEDADRFVQTFGSVALGVGLTDRVGMYAEYFGVFPNADRSDCAHTFNAGLTWLLHEDLQLDVRAGAGLNEEADDFFTGIGMVWRF